jgi:cytoskeletal protein CcmA (bactofilin family)
MFGKKADNKPQGRIDSLIGVGTQIEGNIRFTGGLRIDGEVKGSVEAAEGHRPQHWCSASRHESKVPSVWRTWSATGR